MHIKTLKTTALASETSPDVLTESVEEIIYVKPRLSLVDLFHVKRCFSVEILSFFVWFGFEKKLQIRYLNAAEGWHTLDLTVVYKF